MKQLILMLSFAIATSVGAQKIDYNTDKGYLVEGYDVVSYFQGKPTEGNKKYSTTFKGVKFKFSSQQNLQTFLKNPTKYIPQYGGYCAYAVAEKKTKMDIDPDVYEVRDGKLYLFYSSWFSSKLTDWQEGDTKKLQAKGDKNWKELKHKK